MGSGAIERVARGLYRVAEAEPTEHYTRAAVCARVPSAVVCLLTALSVHELGTGRPTALLAGYCDDHEASARGQCRRELRRQIGTDIDGPDRLVEVGEKLRRFLGPVCDSLIAESPFVQMWPAGGAWRLGVQARTGGEGGD